MSGYRPWAVAGMLGGAVTSIAANMAHVFVPPAGWPGGQEWRPEIGAVIGAVVWPVFLLAASEVLSRKRWASAWSRTLGTLATLVVGAVAAVISYQHLHGLLLHYRETELSAVIGPLAVDGLMIVCSVALVAKDADEVRPELLTGADQGDDLDARVDALLSEGDVRCEHGAPEGFCADPAHYPETVAAQQLPEPSQDLPELGGALESDPESLAAANARTGELLVEALALMASGPPPGADPRPVAAARLERPVTVTLQAGDAPGEDDADPLLTAAGEVAADLAARGRRVTRAALLDGLRDRRHSCSTARGSQLLAQLRASGSA